MSIDLDIKPTEDALAHAINGQPELRDTLSPSALGSFEICGARGEYYKDPNQPRTNTLGTARGRAWHAAMEHYNTFQATLEAAPVTMRSELYGAAVTEFNDVTSALDMTWFPGDSRTDVLAELMVMVDAFCAADPSVRWHEPGISTIAIEKGVLADMGSPIHVMPGIIDAVKLVGETVVGVDYKSAGRAWGGEKAKGDPRKVIQPALYAEAWEQTNPNQGTMDWFCMDVMTVKGKFQRIWYRTDRAARQPFIDRWKSVSAQIAMHQANGLPMPYNPGHILCSEKWCSYWSVCPMGAEFQAVLDPDTRVSVTIGEKP